LDAGELRAASAEGNNASGRNAERAIIKPATARTGRAGNTSVTLELGCGVGAT